MTLLISVLHGEGIHRVPSNFVITTVIIASFLGSWLMLDDDAL